MKRVFITGSSDGLGLLAAKELVKEGHQVFLHARNEIRLQETISKVYGAETGFVGDLSDKGATVNLASELNKIGKFDAIIHNAGVPHTSDRILEINTLAPYILTCLVPAQRLIYLSSGMHLSGDPTLSGLRGETLNISYADSKLHDLILAKTVARKWKSVYANAVNPGWVPTKMGGAGAPDDLHQGFETQVWLAVSDESDALISGNYLHHKSIAKYQTQADDIGLQDEFLGLCERLTGITFPDKW